MKILQYMRDWALIISMVTGVMAYVVYASVPALHSLGPVAWQCVTIVQPALIFCMLLLTFSRVDPRHLRLRRWQLLLLLIQGGVFTAIAMLLIILPRTGLRVVLEGAMICMICPTATAAPVITRRLGGSVSEITTYTILINLLAAILIPALLPYVHPTAGLDTLRASMLILGKVFPLLLMPLLIAWAFRFVFPSLQRRLEGEISGTGTPHTPSQRLVWLQDAPFYLWVVSLALAMTVTTRSVWHSTVGVATQLGLVGVSLASCALQFWLGWRIGMRYGDRVTAGQAFGQKNTVLAIWLGYTFFTPVTSLAGGFYSIWHNVVNSWQLYRHKKHTDPNQGRS